MCSWGRGEDGQLGHGDTDDRLLPTHLSALDAQQIDSIACGADHTLAYSESRNELYSWGWSAIPPFHLFSLLITFYSERNSLLICCFSVLSCNGIELVYGSFGV